jgi:hypothetical protein
VQPEFTKQKAVKRRKTMEGKGDGLVSQNNGKIEPLL